MRISSHLSVVTVKANHSIYLIQHWLFTAVMTEQQMSELARTLIQKLVLWNSHFNSGDLSLSVCWRLPHLYCKLGKKIAKRQVSTIWCLFCKDVLRAGHISKPRFLISKAQNNSYQDIYLYNIATCHPVLVNQHKTMYLEFIVQTLAPNRVNVDQVA